MSTFADTATSLRRFPDVAAPCEPTLELRAEVRTALARETIAVAVEVEGLDEVLLEVEPRGAFSLDIRSLRKSGVVRLKGELDGPATLIASARTASGESVVRMLHVECVGPLLRLLGFGYIPAEG